MTSARTRARMVERLRGKGIRDERVLNALGTVPRHLFLDEALASRAYEDDALPIGFGQTISHPFVVARMIEAVMDARPAGKALEVGTGCGYQAAVMAHVFPEVYSIERIKELTSARAATSSRCGSRTCALPTATATRGSSRRRRFIRSSSPRRRRASRRRSSPSSRSVAE